MHYNREYDSGCGYEYFSGEFIYGDDVFAPDEYMEERWWYIDGAPGYMISDMGRVWSEKSQQFIKPKPMDDHGHLGVSMIVNGRRVYEYIHRLLARAFIPNPENHPIVRHLDDNPNHNELGNLAWGTMRDNARDCRLNGRAHRVTPEEREIGLNKLRTPIVAENIRTGDRTYFESQAQAAETLGIQQANIWKVLNGERVHAGGYYFEYVGGDANDE